MGPCAWGVRHRPLPARRPPPSLVTQYDNLLYACATCNAAKGDRELPDPLVVLTSASVRVAEDGIIKTETPEAARLVEMLGLDSEQSAEFRMLWIGIVALAARHEPELHRRLMGYPDELPDLVRGPAHCTAPALPGKMGTGRDP